MSLPNPLPNYLLELFVRRLYTIYQMFHHEYGTSYHKNPKQMRYKMGLRWHSLLQQTNKNLHTNKYNYYLLSLQQLLCFPVSITFRQSIRIHHICLTNSSYSTKLHTYLYLSWHLHCFLLAKVMPIHPHRNVPSSLSNHNHCLVFA